MDDRLRSFQAEARRAFGFLPSAGFSEPAIAESDGGIRWITATWRGVDAEVEVSLTLAPMGEDIVATSLQTVDGRAEVGVGTAHTSYQMRKALDEQSRVLVETLDGVKR